MKQFPERHGTIRAYASEVTQDTQKKKKETCVFAVVATAAAGCAINLRANLEQPEVHCENEKKHSVAIERCASRARGVMKGRGKDDNGFSGDTWYQKMLLLE